MSTASKTIVLSADGTTATIAPATFTDVLTSLFSLNTVVTGYYGLFQKAGLVVVGGAIDRRISSGAFGVPFRKPS
jgi:hypothetical protein